jgi:hypothetical protein
MAKAKKRVAARKKSSKRGKASVKPTRRKAAKRATPKKAKSKVRRASKSATKLPTEEKRVPAAAETKVPEMTFETTTVIDVIEEPGRPNVVVVEEREIIEERKIA